MTTGGERDLPQTGNGPVRDRKRRMPLVVLIAVWVLLALVAVAGLVTVTVGWGHDAWKGTEAEGNIKTIQAIVLGLGFLGVVAGAVVTYRRQQTMQDQLEEDRNRLDHDRARLDHERLNDQYRLEEDRRKYQLELDKFAQEQAKFAQEQVRETQRRQQERYAQGAQMLADQSPAVRIAGLNVIAALGREVAAEEEFRQTCVNLICAYLRASSPATAHTPPEEGQDASVAVPDDVYRVVAAEACRLLPTLLEEVDPDDDGDEPPHGLDLDLRQVYLIDLDVGGRHLGTVRCDGATFYGSALFYAARFSGAAGFDGATFSGFAGFYLSTFGSAAGFSNATFNGEAGFDGATFSGFAGFYKSTFNGVAGFSKSTFTGAAGFGGATFSKGGAWFAGATFTGAAGFKGATFSKVAGFDGATFSGDALFEGATFSSGAGFGWATFSKVAGFDGATFSGDAWFGEARFVRYSRRLLGSANFAASEPFKGAVFGPAEPDDAEEDVVVAP